MSPLNRFIGLILEQISLGLLEDLLHESRHRLLYDHEVPRESMGFIETICPWEVLLTAESEFEVGVSTWAVDIWVHHSWCTNGGECALGMVSNIPRVCH